MKTHFLLVIALGSAAAYPSTYTGPLQQVLSQVSQTTPGNTRVSIFTGAVTSCSGYPGVYSFDLPSASALSTWTATLLSAIAAGKNVTINGSGTCDQWGIETVGSIAALP